MSLRPPLVSEMHCPHCQAFPNEPCYNKDGRVAQDYHRKRKEAAEEEGRRLQKDRP